MTLIFEKRKKMLTTLTIRKKIQYCMSMSFRMNFAPNAIPVQYLIKMIPYNHYQPKFLEPFPYARDN